MSFISKLFGGNKSEKDVKKLQPLVAAVNNHFLAFQTLTNDALRNKTQEFRSRIKEHLTQIDTEILSTNKNAEELPFNDLLGKDGIYQQVDLLKKERDKKIEEVLQQILPEAFAVVKETARRFKENDEIVSTATQLDRDQSVKKEYIQIDGENAIYKNEWTAAGGSIKWNMVHYDVQLIGGAVLHSGKIAEMTTGEGKTLVSTLPAYLNALAGEGVHIVTVNDYLARRDQEWNGTIFEWLGLTVDCIDKHQPNTEARRKAYLADITYGTNNEFGFDYLRDNMVHSPEEMVQRKHHFAMVDETDSVLIDDARTPLIISGPVPKGDDQQYHILKPRIHQLVEAQERIVRTCLNDAKKLLAENDDDPKSGGLQLYRAHRGLPKYGPTIKFLSEQGVRVKMQKSENYYIADQQKEMSKVDAELLFYIEEKTNSVDLTDKGIALITKSGEDENFFILPDIGIRLADIEKMEGTTEEKLHKKEDALNDFRTKADRIHTVQQLLKAYTMFAKDVEYVVLEGAVKIVDEQTGRILEGRRYSDGLHQAIEAKENVKIEAATQTYATVTLQNYFRMYHKLCGMTGTAETEAAEFWSIYKLDVVTVPTNAKMIRKDHQDLIYKTKREKYKALIQEIETLRTAGRSVLVGTTSVEVSELLSKMLQVKKIPHNVLNAKQHAREAQVIVEAGLSGAITIATNMAGRGTDIKLGAGVKDAGGLAIIGTERHDSRRVDRQLRGRSGRQGDPGSSQFFVCLEDNLMRLFGSERIAKLMDRMGLDDGEVIQHSMITNSIERAQKKVEENNFATRKRLLEYDNVMNSQREVIYKRRKNALFGERLALDILNVIYDTCEDIAFSVTQGADSFDNFKLSIITTFGFVTAIKSEDFKKKNSNDLAQALFSEALEYYDKKSKNIVAQTHPVLKDIFNTRGATVENVVVPYSDGKREMGVSVDLKKAVQGNSFELKNSLERYSSLAFMDMGWKEHLRDMDDLKQSVHNASYEQKDPLLVYKFEGFELFKKFITKINQDIITFIFKSEVPIKSADEVSEGNVERKREKINLSKEEASSVLNSNRPPMSLSTSNQEQEKVMPVKSQKIANRNDRVSVQYMDGNIKRDVKFKTVEDDIQSNKCVILED